MNKLVMQSKDEKSAPSLEYSGDLNALRIMVSFLILKLLRIGNQLEKDKDFLIHSIEMAYKDIKKGK